MQLGSCISLSELPSSERKTQSEAGVITTEQVAAAGNNSATPLTP